MIAEHPYCGVRLECLSVVTSKSTDEDRSQTHTHTHTVKSTIYILNMEIKPRMMMRICVAYIWHRHVVFSIWSCISSEIVYMYIALAKQPSCLQSKRHKQTDCIVTLCYHTHTHIHSLSAGWGGLGAKRHDARSHSRAREFRMGDDRKSFIYTLCDCEWLEALVGWLFVMIS